MPFFYKFGYHLNNIFHMIRHSWIYISMTYMKCIHHLKICFNISIRNSFPVSFFTLSFINNFIIYISEILYKLHFITYMNKIASYNIPCHSRTSISNMWMIIWRHATYINLHLTGCHRHKQ